MKAMINDLTREVDILTRSRSILVEQIKSFVEADSASSRFGHNLGYRAIELAQVDAKLAQTQALLAHARTLEALALKG